MVQAITRYLKQQGYDCVDDDWYARIAFWQQWYSGKVRAFHQYRQYNGKKHVPRERKTLGMAKAIPEDWASLALNEKVEIVVADETVQQRVLAVLDRNQFRVRANQLVERAFALGTGAFVEYRDGNDTKIDYVRAGMIYPLTWDNGKITECAFASERTVQKQKQVYLNIHRLENGKYVIENHLFRRTGTGDSAGMTEIDLPAGVLPVYRTGSETPLFQIVRPNISNNIDPDSPMGLSVYANAIDQLEGLDLVYDSYVNEFRLGKKRITVPITMARMQLEEDGSTTPVFEDNDTEFYAIPAVQDGENKIVEHNMELRYQAHEAGIQTALNLLSFKCGMGKDRYNFQDGQVKTATEVVSEKSELYQNLRKHELVLSDAVTGLVRAVARLEGFPADVEVSVNFDDSIIEDVGAEKQVFLQEIRDGVRQKWEYRVKFFGEDKETAQSMANQAPEETLGFGGDG